MGYPAAEPPFEEESEPIPRAKGRPDGTQPDWLVGPEEGMSAESKDRPTMPRLSVTPGGARRPPSPAAPVPGAGLPPPPSPVRIAPGEASANPGVPRNDLPDMSQEMRTHAFRSPGKEMDESLYTWRKPEGEAEEPGQDEPVDIDETIVIPHKPRAGGGQSVTAIVVNRRTMFDDEDRPAPKPDAGAALRGLFGNPLVLIVLACVLGAALFWYYAWPRMKPGVSISSIRRNATQLDGRIVTVRGRVGEVFPVGGSYVFYLHQGRDTLVVFSSTRMPTPKDELLVTGKVSIGFLEGVPRAALFEQAQ